MSHEARLRELAIALPVAPPAVPAMVIGPLELHRPQRRQQLSGPPVVIARRVAAITRTPTGYRQRFRQQAAEKLRADAVHGPTHQHLDRLQIDASAAAGSSEDHLQQAAYFPGDFLLDGRRRFFSSGVRVCSTGRKRQIRSLTSLKDRLNCCQRRKASISRSALRWVAALPKLSVTVLPFTL